MIWVWSDWSLCCPELSELVEFLMLGKYEVRATTRHPLAESTLQQHQTV